MASKGRNGERKRPSARARREAARIAERLDTFHAASEGLRKLYRATQKARAAQGAKAEGWIG